MKIKTALQRANSTKSMGVMALRAGIVGLNFLVMLGLAAHLGLAGFGALVYLWGGAMVASTVVSCGGPLILLRGLSDGSGLSPLAVVGVVVVCPALICLAGWGLLQGLWPDPRWAVILSAGFCINALGAIASIMRALGSVQMSMALRDGGPFVALGIAALLPFGGAVPTVLAAAGLMAVTGVAAAVWCCAHWINLPPATTPRRWCWSWSLWGTSVLGMGVAQVDILIGGAVMDAESLGLYAFLRRIANVVALPVSVATWVSAKPVATAFGAGDMRALRLASADGSRIAWYPACILAALSLAAVTLAAALPWLDVTPMIAGCFVILVAGALMQAFCAAGLTVATLTRYARLAAIARALTLLAYLSMVGMIGGVLSPVSNALAYGVAAVLGSLLVWGVLWRELGVDTSARVLWQQGRAGWKTS